MEEFFPQNENLKTVLCQPSVKKSQNCEYFFGVTMDVPLPMPILLGWRSIRSRVIDSNSYLLLYYILPNTLFGKWMKEVKVFDPEWLIVIHTCYCTTSSQIPCLENNKCIMNERSIWSEWLIVIHTCYSTTSSQKNNDSFLHTTREEHNTRLLLK